MKSNTLKMLVAEDRLDRFTLVDKCIDKSKFTVTRTTSGSETFNALKDGDYDIALLDLHLSDKMSGQAVIEAIHRIKPNLPIVAMTNESGDPVVAECLALGAEDFLMAPFSESTFRARIQKALYHANSRKVNEPLRYGPVAIDPPRHKGSYNGQEFTIAGNQIPVLQMLVGHQGSVVASADLEKAGWGSVIHASTRLNHVITKLRKKMTALGAPEEVINNHKGVGYAIEF